MIEKIFLIVLIILAVVCVYYTFVLIKFMYKQDYNTTDELIKTLTSSKNFLKRVSEDELEELMKEFDNYEVWVHEDEKQVFITEKDIIYTPLNLKHTKVDGKHVIYNELPKPKEK